MDRAQLWTIAFKSNQSLLERNLTGLDGSLAAQAPAPGANSANWILGHVVVARRGILGLLGQPQPKDPALAPYGRGGDGQGGALSWDDLFAHFGTLGETMAAAIAAVPDWDKPTLNPALQKEQPLEQVLAFLYMHEAYHLGQIGLVRKLVGLEGGIK
jgi:uncharacterized damage-inducible protein DinB